MAHVIETTWLQLSVKPPMTPLVAQNNSHQPESSLGMIKILDLIFAHILGNYIGLKLLFDPLDQRRIYEIKGKD